MRAGLLVTIALVAQLCHARLQCASYAEGVAECLIKQDTPGTDSKPRLGPFDIEIPEHKAPLGVIDQAVCQRLWWKPMDEILRLLMHGKMKSMGGTKLFCGIVSKETMSEIRPHCEGEEGNILASFDVYEDNKRKSQVLIGLGVLGQVSGIVLGAVSAFMARDGATTVTNILNSAGVVLSGLGSVAMLIRTNFAVDHRDSYYFCSDQTAEITIRRRLTTKSAIGQVIESMPICFRYSGILLSRPGRETTTTCPIYAKGLTRSTWRLQTALLDSRDSVRTAPEDSHPNLVLPPPETLTVKPESQSENAKRCIRLIRSSMTEAQIPPDESHRTAPTTPTTDSLKFGTKGKGFTVSQLVNNIREASHSGVRISDSCHFKFDEAKSKLIVR